MRQVVLDTETTGLEVEQMHRIIEIGCVELFNRRLTGRVFHRYLNPERDIDEGAQQVHGITREQLLKEPKFCDVAAQFLEFIEGAQLIIHNAPFDVAFLDAELKRLAAGPQAVGAVCPVLDTLALARQMHPGQRNNLDALCKRYGVDNSRRDCHGALLDARLLADVYLAMTGGQAVLTLDPGHANEHRGPAGQGHAGVGHSQGGWRIAVVAANAEELAAHAEILQCLDKSSGGKTVWRRL